MNNFAEVWYTFYLIETVACSQVAKHLVESRRVLMICSDRLHSSWLTHRLQEYHQKSSWELVKLTKVRFEFDQNSVFALEENFHLLTLGFFSRRRRFLH